MLSPCLCPLSKHMEKPHLVQVMDEPQPTTHADACGFTSHPRGHPRTSTYKVSGPPPEHTAPRQGPLPGEGYFEVSCLLHCSWEVCRMPSCHLLVFYWLLSVCSMGPDNHPLPVAPALWILCAEELTAPRGGLEPHKSFRLGQAGPHKHSCLWPAAGSRVLPGY